MQPLSSFSSAQPAASIIASGSSNPTHEPAQQQASVQQVPGANPIPADALGVSEPALLTSDCLSFVESYENSYQIVLPNSISRKDLKAIKDAFWSIKFDEKGCFKSGLEYQEIIASIQDPQWQEGLLFLGIKLQQRFLVAEKVGFLEAIQKIDANSIKLSEAAVLLVDDCNYSHQNKGNEESLCYSRQNYSELLQQTLEKSRESSLSRIVNALPVAERVEFLKVRIIEAMWHMDPHKKAIIAATEIIEEEKSKLYARLEEQEAERTAYTRNQCAPS